MTKEDKVKPYPNSIDTRVALLEASISHLNDTLVRIETKMDREFDAMKSDIKEIKKDMKYDFRFVIGAICALAAVMAHGFHWF